MTERTEERLVRIETKLDIALGNYVDHEARLRTLEKARWPLPSLAFLVSFAALAMELIGRIQ